MNDAMAERVIEDHKYLLYDVQNRAAIAYFAAFNRNMSLYSALRYYMEPKADDNVVDEVPEDQEETKLNDRMDLSSDSLSSGYQ